MFVTRRDGKVDWSSVEDAERSRVPLQDRLHHEADERAAMREKMKRDLEAQEMSSYPFKPSINPRSNAILNMNAYKPIHERIEDLQKQNLPVYINGDCKPKKIILILHFNQKLASRVDN